MNSYTKEIIAPLIDIENPKIHLIAIDDRTGDIIAHSSLKTKFINSNNFDQLFLSSERLANELMVKFLRKTIV